MIVMLQLGSATNCQSLWLGLGLNSWYNSFFFFFNFVWTLRLKQIVSFSKYLHSPDLIEGLSHIWQALSVWKTEKGGQIHTSLLIYTAL